MTARLKMPRCFANGGNLWEKLNTRLLIYIIALLVSAIPGVVFQKNLFKS